MAMKLAEFKAWFEGYTENIDGAPTAKQWKRIKARVGEIDGEAVTERIYLDRYYPGYEPYRVWCSTAADFSGTHYITFNSTAAMASLGALDANADAAD